MRPLALAIALLVLPFGHRPSPASSGRPLSKWTLILYWDADNNLESRMLAQFEQFLPYGGNSDVRIVALVDRSKGKDPPEFSDAPVGGVADWSGAKIVEVDRCCLRDCTPGPGTLAGMGCPETLARILDYAGSNCPAEHYALILNDHGLGTGGVCTDSNAPQCDHPEVEGVLSLAGIATGCSRFAERNGCLDLIVFDACTMATVEVATTVAPFARFMVGPQDDIPNIGMSFRGAMDLLTADPDAGPETLGRALVNDWNAPRLLAELTRDDAGHMEMIDLGAIPLLNAAMDSLGSALEGAVAAGGSRAWASITRERLKCSPIQVHSACGPGCLWNCAECDLLAWVRGLASTGNPRVRAAALAVERGVRRAVLAGGTTYGREDLGGLSAYLPCGRCGYCKVAYPDWLWRGDWARFRTEYAGLGCLQGPGIALTDVELEAPVPGCPDGIGFSARVLTDREWLGPTFVILGNYQSGNALGYPPVEPDSDGVLRGRWNGNWFSIEAGEGYFVVQLAWTHRISDDRYVARAPILINALPGNAWLLLERGPQGWHGRVISITRVADGLESGFELSATDVLRARPRSYELHKLNADATVSSLFDRTMVVGQSGLRVGVRRVPAGDYTVGFVAITLDGQERPTLETIHVP